MTGPITHTAPVCCPQCGREFTGRWAGGRSGAQRCPACGHEFGATWPGFHFEPEDIAVIARIVFAVRQRQEGR